ncbi:MAG: serine hydrolase domain-containing protein, partial [Chitinophagaceae bacterium]
QVIIFLFIAGFKTAAQVSAPDIYKKIDSILSEYDSLKPGLAIAIVKDGKIDFKKGYGLANLEYDIPITPETKFHIASVSKQFTAFSIYLLKKEGKISLEDDVRKYIPELPEYGKTIKIKNLLAHTSGLRDQWALLTLAGWQMEDIITTEQILKTVFSQRGLNFEPDSQVGYSNTGYTLLAEIVSRVSGKSFPDFTRDNIFVPLGMNNTVFKDDFHNVVKNSAHSYELVKGKFEERRLNYSTAGATSLTTTVEDLAKWVLNFEKPVVGDRELIKEFSEISKHDNGNYVISSARPNDTTYHAKGQLHWKHKGISVISHGGHDAGFRAVLMRFPEKNLAIITLSNNEHYQMLGKVLPIADLYLKGSIITEAATQPTNAQAQKKEPFSNQLTDYIGSYYSQEISTEYKIKVTDTKLIMTHSRLGDIELTPVGTDKFSGRNSFLFELQFERKSNTITGFTISNYGVKNLRFARKG